MKRSVLVAVLAALAIMSVAGTVFAENGSIVPWVKVTERGTIDPFGGSVRTQEHGTILPWDK